MKDYRLERIDKFGRNYPDKIVMKNGDVLIGQSALQKYNTDGTLTITLFRIIENLEDWKSNKISIGTKNVSLEEKDIEEISTIIDY